MTVDITITNADNALVSALKSVCRLNPAVKVSVKMQGAPADEVRTDRMHSDEAGQNGKSKFLELAGKIDIDSTAVDGLRERSSI